MRSDVGGADERDTRAGLADVADRAVAQMSAENFPVALRLLPATPRAQLTRVYAFARFVDDVGDEASGDRLALLAAVTDELQGQADGVRSWLAPVAGLGPVLAAGVVLQPFLDLVEANVMDQRVSRYESQDDLLGYCALSAAPIGRIVLHLAGAATPANVADSDAVCAALQILEHCQDVGEDARAGRVYLPARDLRAYGVTDADLAATRASAALRGVVARQVVLAEQWLRAATPFVARLRGWARPAVAGYVAGGLATADALRAAGFDVLAHDVRPAKTRTAAHAARVLIAGARRA